jgi:hypothetical protein
MDSAELKQFRFRNCLRPNTLVVVAADRSNWRDGLQSRKHIGGTDIAAMNDTIATLQERRCLWSQEPMSVRDDAESGHRFSL